MLNSPWSILLYYVLKYALLSHISTLDIVNGQIFQGTYFSLAIDTIVLLSTAKKNTFILGDTVCTCAPVFPGAFIVKKEYIPGTPR